MPGKMVQCLKSVGTSNPLVLIDEIDKVFMYICIIGSFYLLLCGVVISILVYTSTFIFKIGVILVICMAS